MQKKQVWIRRVSLEVSSRMEISGINEQPKWYAVREIADSIAWRGTDIDLDSPRFALINCYALKNSRSPII